MTMKSSRQFVPIKVLDERLIENDWLPRYEHFGDAGVDLRLLLPRGQEQAVLGAGQLIKVGTGIAVNMKEAPMMGLIAARSSLGHKKGIVLSNSVGIIDAGYQGEITLTLVNRGFDQQVIKHGERVAQLIFLPVFRAIFKIVDEFQEETERGANGFGSTGEH